MAGVAGALYVPQVGIINPGEFAPANSIEYRDLGRGRRPRHAGRRDLGAVLVNYAKTWFTGGAPAYWLFALGGLFVASSRCSCPRASSARCRPGGRRAASVARGGEPRRPRRPRPPARRPR
jgi:hypothetical protein